MAGVDLLPSAYLNFRGTKAWVDQPCPAGVEKWQSNNCPPLWRPKCLFSCPLTSASVLHAEWGRRSFKKGWYLPPQADEHSSVVFPQWLPVRENTSATISVFTLTYFLSISDYVSFLWRSYRSKSNWDIILRHHGDLNDHSDEQSWIPSQLSCCFSLKLFSPLNIWMKAVMLFASLPMVCLTKLDRCFSLEKTLKISNFAGLKKMQSGCRVSRGLVEIEISWFHLCSRGASNVCTDFLPAVHRNSKCWSLCTTGF